MRSRAPWPDLVLCTGRRMSMVALWIRKQSQGSQRSSCSSGSPEAPALALRPGGGRRAIRPARARATSCASRCPLMRLDPAELEARSTRVWKGRLDGLAEAPSPPCWWGGTVRVAVFDADATRRLAEGREGRSPERDGGTVYVVTSRRTQPHVVEALEAALPAGEPAATASTSGGDNPYRALLARADRFVVTSDSLSMMAEVARLSRARCRSLHALAVALELGADVASPSRPGCTSRRCSSIGASPYRWGNPFREPAGPPPDELSEVSARIRALLAQ